MNASHTLGSRHAARVPSASGVPVSDRDARMHSPRQQKSRESTQRHPWLRRHQVDTTAARVGRGGFRLPHGSSPLTPRRASHRCATGCRVAAFARCRRSSDSGCDDATTSSRGVEGAGVGLQRPVCPAQPRRATQLNCLFLTCRRQRALHVYVHTHRCVADAAQSCLLHKHGTRQGLQPSARGIHLSSN